MIALPRRGLYALVDTATLDARAIAVVPFAEAVLAGRPALLQLRAKNRGARDTLALLRALAPLAERAGVPFFANDRPDLASLAGVPGVHVGQDDLPFAEVRRAFPELAVGISTHDPTQLAEAIEAGPAYVAFGPVYPTSSKDNPDPVVGLAALRQAVVRAQGKPVVGIGGVDEARAPEIAAAGAIGAVIGALVPPAGEAVSFAWVSARTARLQALLGVDA